MVFSPIDGAEPIWLPQQPIRADGFDPNRDSDIDVAITPLIYINSGDDLCAEMGVDVDNRTVH